MAPVEILIDLSGLQPIEEGMLGVEGPQDYVGACLSLREKLRATATTDGGSLTVVVHESTVAVWLRALTQSYVDSQVRTNEYTAREALAQHWSIAVPADIADPDILKSHLLEEDATARPGQCLEDLLLERFYGAPFAYGRLPIDQLGSLMNGFDPVQWNENASRPLVARALRKRLLQWVERETNESRQEVIQRIGTDPVSLRRDLRLFAVLNHYPAERADRVLGDSAEVFRRAGVDTVGLTLDDEDLTPARREIEYYLRTIKSAATTAEDMRALLDMMSGRLETEFAAIEAIVDVHQSLATAEFIGQVERRFGTMRGVLASRLARLRRMISPPAPPRPIDSWSIDEWLDWVRTRYMPYYRWLESSGRRDDQVAEYATQFADWFFAHFRELKNGSATKFAFSGLQLERDRIRAADRVTLVLILDNFSYAFFDELQQLFAQLDFTLVADQPMLSLIPTSTPIGKPPLICGEGDQTLLATDDYAALVNNSWAPILNRAGKSADYLSSIGDLRELKERTHDLYVLNYLPIDALLHEDRQKLGLDHRELVFRALEELVRVVADFGKRFQIMDHLQVYVTADHGSTRIARDTVNVLDKQFFKKVASDKHHRFIAVSDEQLRDRPQMVGEQCYVMDRQWFGTRDNYFVARGYYRFAETTDSFYVHGGLTPEEVVVPFARFELNTQGVLAPDVALVSDQFRYTVRSAFKLELRNPNSYPLESIEARLKGIAGEGAVIGRLDPRDSAEVDLPVTFRREPGTGNTRDVVVQIRYECQSRQFGPVEVPFTVTLKGMMEAKDEFDF